MNSLKFILPAFLVGITLIDKAIASAAAPSVDDDYKSKVRVVVKDSFYMAQMPQYDLRLVMKRLVGHTFYAWEDYMPRQSKVATNPDGTDHFKEVLQTTCQHNETWVCYATEDKDLPLDFDNFSLIQMYVTVTSNPGARLTSHMGISRVCKGRDEESLALAKKYPNISLDVHSFAMKVMLMINPDLLFMLTVPVSKMAGILMQDLPAGSVFVGRKELKEKVEEENSADFEASFASTTASKLIKTSFYDFLDPEERLKTPSEYAQALLEFWKKHPPLLSIKKENRDLGSNIFNTIFVIYDPKKPTEILLEIDPIGEKTGVYDTYAWLYKEVFREVGCASQYVLVDSKALASARLLGELKS